MDPNQAYSAAEVERMMKLQDVLLKAMAGKMRWWEAAEIIGVSDRTMRRWRERLEKHGYDGLTDRRKGKRSQRRVPVKTCEEVLRLYQERYFDLSTRHFHEKLNEEHSIKLSYTWVKQALQGAGLVDTKVEWLANPSMALYAVTFINIWSGYPFYMMSLLAGLQGISSDLYEAARVDGASGFQRFTHITIPQLRPIIVSIALLDVIFTTQQFALIWLTTGGGPINVTEMLSTFTYKLAFNQYEFSVASASAVIVLVLSMVLAFFYVRSQRMAD